MLIRAATTDDAPVLWRAEVETAKIPGRLVSRPDELLLEAFVTKIGQLSAGGSYVVADGGEEIEGHAFLERMPLLALRHVARLTVVVHPGHTGRGIGTALIQHLQRWAHAQGDLEKVELLVRATNTSAVSLYRRLGFVEEGRLRNRVRLPDGQLIDDLTMAWFPETSPGQ
jgi:ribosomal protein S18 acetylase RimI-like enzyme